MNKLTKNLVTTLTIIFSPLSWGDCISDLYTAGLSLDSFSYEVENNDTGSTAQINSSSGAGIKIGKIIYCPESQREYYPYFRARFFSLDEANDQEGFEDLKDDVSLAAFGMDTRFIQDYKKEILLDLAIREEYKPTNVTPDGFGLYDETYGNLKIATGLRYFVFSNQSEDYTASLKAGALFPVDGNDIEPGFLLEGNAEYFKRMNKNYSIRADIYYSFYQQDIDSFTVRRNEIGMRYNYVFKY